MTTAELLALPVGEHVIEDTEQHQRIITRSVAGWVDRIIWKQGHGPAPLTSEQQLGEVVVALALLTLDEINLLRQWITDFKAQVAAATSLANLQTRVAALPNLPPRTRDQLMNAVAQKIGS